MKTFSILAFIFFSIALQAQDYSSAPLLERKDRVMYSVETGEPFNGTYTLDHENGKPFIRGEYRNGLKEGRWVSYDSLGNLKSEESFIRDRWEGVRKTYFSNGLVEREMGFKNGVGEGVQKEYYDNGKLKVSFTFVNGQKEGKWLYYHSNGKKWEEGNFKSDLYDGKWTTWNEEGKKNLIRKFEKDKMIKEQKKGN
jgi:antitoxin component YwqK of YwqJK toxin-antitoxin module